LKSFKVATKLN